MKSKDWFPDLATGIVVVASVFMTGCGTAPEVVSPEVATDVATQDDPFLVGAADGDVDPSPLFAAIADGELERVRALLADGDDVNQHDPIYGTPLVAALQTGEDDMIAAVLEAGASRNGASAFFLAAAKLPETVLDPAVRAVADQFADRNEVSLRVHEELSALLLFDIPAARGQPLVDQTQADMIEEGWFLFRFAHDARRREDVVGLLPTPEKYVVLAYLQTDGLNYNIKTERIIDWLVRLESEDPFVVTEAGLDYVGGRFLQRIGRPGQLAQRMFAFCPDIVDQGVGSVANLEKELAKPAPPLYLWWD